MTDVEKIANAATDEIYDSVQFVLSEAKVYGTGNHWINTKYNLFCETYTDWNDKNTVMERMAYDVKLEEYDDNENCIDCEVDCEESHDMSKESLYETIMLILEHHPEILV